MLDLHSLTDEFVASMISGHVTVDATGERVIVIFPTKIEFPDCVPIRFHAETVLPDQFCS
jgi:hypothetical protein